MLNFLRMVSAESVLLLALINGSNKQPADALEIIIYIVLGIIFAACLVAGLIAYKQSDEELVYKKADKISELIYLAGYAYDNSQNIFYSHINAWQRKFGYCRLYDEAAAPMGMIVDCEPIYFEYQGKKWLIEFWKGQYDLTTGCEVGVYYTKRPELVIPGVFNGTFYDCVSNEDMLPMSCILRKNHLRVITRKAVHWWLTGFKVGEFSEPYELSMDITITFKDQDMANAFIGGLMRAGYSRNEFVLIGNTVSLTFDKTHTKQPVTRTKLTDRLIQWKNKLMCKMFMKFTSAYNTMPEKLQVIRKRVPFIYRKIMLVGRYHKVSKAYNKIKDYLS